MKKYLYLLLLTACSKDFTLQSPVTVADIRNGHSIISEYKPVTTSECLNSGVRLDMFIDINDNLVVDETDIFQNSVVICNGLQGEQGLQGTQGNTGEQGNQGEQGIPGEQGNPGEQGAQGEQGIQGEQGEPGIPGPSAVMIQTYNSTTCTLIQGSNIYMKRTSSIVFTLYSSSTCTTAVKLADIKQGQSYWVANNMLSVWSNDSLRVITFNL